MLSQLSAFKFQWDRYHRWQFGSHVWSVFICKSDYILGSVNIISVERGTN